MQDDDKISMTISIIDEAVKELQFNKHDDLEITTGLLVELITHVQSSQKLNHNNSIKEIEKYLKAAKIADGIVNNN